MAQIFHFGEFTLHVQDKGFTLTDSNDSVFIVDCSLLDSKWPIEITSDSGRNHYLKIEDGMVFIGFSSRVNYSGEDDE